MTNITFLSDFGLVDEWVAVCKGVIRGISPESSITDISHVIPSFDVRKASLVLASAVSFFPKGTIHIAVVDPGVGTARSAIALKTKRNDVLLGPDNGLLLPAAKALGGIKSAFSVENKKFFLKPVSYTFHGRDIFAPVAAYLASGVKLAELGPKLSEDDLVTPPWREGEIIGETLEAEVIDIDRFGTVRLNIDPPFLIALEIKPGDKLSLFFKDQIWILPFCRAFGEVKFGEGLLLVDSSNFLSLAINQQKAADKFGLTIGDPVWIAKSPEKSSRAEELKS